jgi:hypothetical protein
MMGLNMLKYINDLSDEEVVKNGLEIPTTSISAAWTTSSMSCLVIQQALRDGENAWNAEVLKESSKIPYA